MDRPGPTAGDETSGPLPPPSCVGNRHRMRPRSSAAQSCAWTEGLDRPVWNRIASPAIAGDEPTKAEPSSSSKQPTRHFTPPWRSTARRSGPDPTQTVPSRASAGEENTIGCPVAVLQRSEPSRLRA
jgi:hypothetical protein